MEALNAQLPGQPQVWKGRDHQVVSVSEFKSMTKAWLKVESLSSISKIPNQSRLLSDDLRAKPWQPQG